MLFMMTLAIPKNAQNPELSEQFINFMLTPKIAARNIEYVGYSSPNTPALALLDASWSANAAFNISKDDLARSEIFKDLPSDVMKSITAYPRSMCPTKDNINPHWRRQITLFLTSQTVSLLGSAIVAYAIIWYVTLTTASGLMMTLSTLFSLPQICVSLFAGVG